MADLRQSLDLIRMVRPEAGTSALEHEIAAERANSLGSAEARVIKTIERYGQNGSDTDLADARNAVWSYFVQRELLGFRQHADVIRDLKIPPVVLNGLGVMPAKKP